MTKGSDLLEAGFLLSKLEAFFAMFLLLWAQQLPKAPAPVDKMGVHLITLCEKVKPGCHAKHAAHIDLCFSFLAYFY